MIGVGLEAPITETVSYYGRKGRTRRMPQEKGIPPEKLELRLIIINIMRINQLLPIRMTIMRVP